MRHRMLLLLPLLALLLGACVDHRHDPVQPEWTAAAHQVPGAMSLDTIPPRTDDLAGPWEEMVAEELWDHLEAQGGYAILGVKNPGEPRGIWRGTVLTEPAAMTGAENAVGAMAGVDVLRTYEPLPALKVRLSGVDDIVALRSRPFTDYLQPLVIAGAGDGGAAAMSGCRWGDPYTGGAPTTSQGDFIPPGLARMGIRAAWNRNAGEAAVIGIADTGIAPTQDNLDSNFSSGESDTGRWHDIRTVTAGETDDQCGHGTRVAGLALAPKNGSSIVGAAWKANGVSVRQGNGVHTWLGGGIDAGDAADAILMAVEERYNPLQGGYSERRIVSLAWGARTAHSSVEDAVRFVKGFYGA